MTALATLETRMELEPKCVTHLFSEIFYGDLPVSYWLGRYHLVNWLLRSCAGNWIKIPVPLLKKQSHSATQHNTDQLSLYTSK